LLVGTFHARPHRGPVAGAIVHLLVATFLATFFSCSLRAAFFFFFGLPSSLFLLSL
jgi:hypothetical protein